MHDKEGYNDFTKKKKKSVKYNLLKGFFFFFFFLFSFFSLNSTEFRGGLCQNAGWLFLGKYVTDGL